MQGGDSLGRCRPAQGGGDAACHHPWERVALERKLQAHHKVEFAVAPLRPTHGWAMHRLRPLCFCCRCSQSTHAHICLTGLLLRAGRSTLACASEARRKAGPSTSLSTAQSAPQVPAQADLHCSPPLTCHTTVGRSTACPATPLQNGRSTVCANNNRNSGAVSLSLSLPDTALAYLKCLQGQLVHSHDDIVRVVQAPSW